MSKSVLERQALAAFERVIAGTPGFRSRPGQLAMAQRIASTLAGVTLGDNPEPTRAVVVIQAGTGVGKSAAYASTMVALALALKTRLLISTATVALQEQLMGKDLPALAAVLETPFAFALAKGRGRYVCKLKLDRLQAGAVGEPDDDFLRLMKTWRQRPASFPSSSAGSIPSCADPVFTRP